MIDEEVAQAQASARVSWEPSRAAAVWMCCSEVSRDVRGLLFAKLSAFGLRGAQALDVQLVLICMGFWTRVISGTGGAMSRSTICKPGN